MHGSLPGGRLIHGTAAPQSLSEDEIEELKSEIINDVVTKIAGEVIARCLAHLSPAVC